MDDENIKVKKPTVGVSFGYAILVEVILSIIISIADAGSIGSNYLLLYFSAGDIIVLSIIELVIVTAIVHGFRRWQWDSKQTLSTNSNQIPMRENETNINEHINNHSNKNKEKSLQFIVKNWKDVLKENSLEEYIYIFEKNKLTELEILSELTESDIEKLGVNIMGDRKKLLKIFSLKNLSLYYQKEEQQIKEEMLKKPKILRVRENTYLLEKPFWEANRVISLEAGEKVIVIEQKEGEDKTIWINAKTSSGYYTGWINAGLLSVVNLEKNIQKPQEKSSDNEKQEVKRHIAEEKTKPKVKILRVRENTYLLEKPFWEANRVISLEAGEKVIVIEQKEGEDKTIWINAKTSSGYYTGWINAGLLEEFL